MTVIGVLVATMCGGIAASYALDVPAEGGLALRFPTGRLRTASRRDCLVILAGCLISGCSTMFIEFTVDKQIPMAAFCVSAVLGVILGIVDCRVQRLPHAITGLMFTICAFAFIADSLAYHDAEWVPRTVAATVVVLIVFLSLAVLFVGQLGLGDVVLAGWVAFSLAWTSWGAAVLGLLIGLVAQAMVTLGVILAHGNSRPGGLPLGPALLLGWLAALAVAS